MKFACVLLFVAMFAQLTIANESEDAHAVQIVSPKDRMFRLELDDLKSVLENDSIKDRNVVVVSIAGAFRQGKSFLLNFFIKYLYAQYKIHDVSDWIGENGNGKELSGFKWRSGRKRETTGIWMWSDIFTHDFANGEKVAIILLDTQGIFDDQTSVKACTTIFALSMMLSSVQCYNIMQKIQEDNLQHLELFTEYGRLALEQSNEKPFQKLLFIVRDWPYAFETPYGWHGQEIIDEFLAHNDDQTPEMRQLRTRIESSFDGINAFLMPFPGMTVAQGNNFTGDVQQIQPEFRKHVKELVTGLFAPDKLVLKKIAGEKVRVRDLVKYLEVYLDIFNGDTLPEPKSVLLATAEASMQILFTDCVHFYIDVMQKLINEVENYFTQGDLIQMHQKTKNEAIAQFQAKPKLGGDQLASTFQHKIETEIEAKFHALNETNEAKYKSFVDKANLNNEKVVIEVTDAFERKLIGEIDASMALLKQSDLNDLFMSSKQIALQEFDSRKMGNGEMVEGPRGKLVHDFDRLQLDIMRIFESHHEHLKSYSDTLESSINSVESFLSQNDLVKLHQTTKRAAQSQFSESTKNLDGRISTVFQRKLEMEIEQKYPTFEQSNERKRNDFIVRANAHNEIISNEIKAKVENQVRNGIGRNYLSDNDFINLFMTSKVAALNEFAARKMGDGEISNGIREKLEREIDGLQAALKQANEANKPPPPKKKKKGFGGILDVVVGVAANVAGAAIGGAMSGK